MIRRFKTTLPVLAALLVAAAAARGAAADTLLSLKTHVDAFQVGGIKQDARDTDTKLWVSEQRVRRDDGQISTILRMDQNKMYLVNHTTKTYNVFDLPIDYKKLYPQGGEEMVERMSQMAKMDVTVKPSEEKRKIDDWQVQRYDVVMTNPLGMKIETIMWMSQDVGVDAAAFSKMTAAAASLKPGTMDWVKKMEQVKGFPVLQETTMTAMGTPIKSKEQLVSVEKKDAPAGTYDPPAGYAQKPFDPMQPGMQQ